MNEKALVKLEFNKIIDKLAEKAASEAGKEKCRKLEPSTNIFEINRMQQETDEAFRYLVIKSTPSFGGLHDIRGAVNRTAIGAILSMKELLDIADSLYVVQKIKAYGKRENNLIGIFENLDPLFDGLQPMRNLEDEIRRCILSEEEMSDNASTKLHNLRREIGIQQERVRSQLQNMIRSNTYKTMLQDQVITMRGGRFCLPVKAEHKNSITGMVHDQSSSGSTLFIEPIAVVQTNNKITELMAQEEEEIQRILQELSQMVHTNHKELMANFTILTDLDFIFAKARLALEMNAVKPIMNEDGIIEILNARHPLLNPKKVVPISIRLGGEFTSLVITGPNTGGKTVTLKTLGLLSLMGQAGLHIPTSDKPKLMVLDQVFADIGDEQSIEQSLSTFSSHMVNIVEILDQVTPWSLVLFDELGAGTDPTEGAALAQAILDNLRQRRILTAATTHYSELKVYALSTKGVENASCEFDVDTLQPTYRLLIGVPGKSNAFAISKRLGLTDDIIHEAGELLESNDVKFEDMMSDLELRRLQIEEEQNRIQALRMELSRLQEETQTAKEKLERQKERIIEQAQQEARETLRKAKEEADQTIARMNKLIQQGQTVDMSALEKERTRLREKVSEMDEAMYEPLVLKKKALDLKQLIPGVKVLIAGFDQEYSVLNKPDARGNVTVQAGIMKMQIKTSEIVQILQDPEDKPKKQKKAESSVSAGSFGKAQTIHLEVDLRGMMTDEGIAVLDKYLDDAYLAGMTMVRVIHGKGTGAMRKAVHQFLRKAAHVASYRIGTLGEGDTGVTVVEIKKRK